jgi:hypothetical protein
MRISVGLVVALAPACGGIAIIDDDGSETTPPGEEPRCGRPGDAECGAAEFCDRPEGTCEGEGVCQPRPPGCSESGPIVCGCDGATYPNECVAQQSGVDAAGDAWCPMAPSARAQFRSERMLTVKYVDPDPGVCVHVHAEKDVGASFAVAMWSTWQVTHIEAQEGIEGCMNGGIRTDLVAIEASGSISIVEESPGHCGLAVDLAVAFPAVSWLESPLAVVSHDTGIEDHACH